MKIKTYEQGVTDGVFIALQELVLQEDQPTLPCSSRPRPQASGAIPRGEMMPVYIDDYYAPFRGMRMCHMIADTHEELLEMADKIGVQRKWLQAPGSYKEHFDVCGTKRNAAIVNGAVPITVMELGSKLIERRNALRGEK